jgi:hypothetical protein
VVALSAAPRIARAPRSGDQAGTLGLRLKLPVASAVGAGLISAGVWTYGPTAAVGRGALEADQAGLLWTALGVGGLAGAFINRLVTRWGPVTAFAFCTALLLVSSIGVLAPQLQGRGWLLLSVGLFGAAYMAMSGALILWGRLLDASRGAALTAWLFIALAVGQAAGSLVLGPVLT